LNGILNRKAACQDAYLTFHDWVFDEEESAGVRHTYMQDILMPLLDWDFVEIATPLCYTSQIGKMQWYAAKIWGRSSDEGNEGVIGKLWSAPYQMGKRNASIINIKRELTVDCRVLAVISGKGKYKGTTGALLVTEKNGQQHRVSGMSDKERHDWYANPDLIVGKVVELEAMVRLSNGSLREARYKATRHDKSVEDYD
jgi:ribosomal protein L24